VARQQVMKETQEDQQLMEMKVPGFRSDEADDP